MTIDILVDLLQKAYFPENDETDNELIEKMENLLDKYALNKKIKINRDTDYVASYGWSEAIYIHAFPRCYIVTSTSSSQASRIPIEAEL